MGIRGQSWPISDLRKGYCVYLLLTRGGDKNSEIKQTSYVPRPLNTMRSVVLVTCAWNVLPLATYEMTKPPATLLSRTRNALKATKEGGMNRLVSDVSNSTSEYHCVTFGGHISERVLASHIGRGRQIKTSKVRVTTGNSYEIYTIKNAVRTKIFRLCEKMSLVRCHVLHISQLLLLSH